MSATVVSDPMAISTTESQSQTQVQSSAVSANGMSGCSSGQMEVEFAKCYCCGLTEECTPAYIARIRERYHGRWICGLCSEAVKDEIYRSERLIGMDEALTRHMNFCKKFSSSAPMNPTVHLISAMRQLLRRSLDSPRAMRSTPNSPVRVEDEEKVRRASLARSGSCFSTLSSWGNGGKIRWKKQEAMVIKKKEKPYLFFVLTMTELNIFIWVRRP